MFLPLFFKTDNLNCLIIGGGEIAAHKIAALEELSCSLTVIAPRINDSVRERVGQKRVRWLEREYRPDDCRSYQLVIAATQDREINRTVSEEAQALGIPVNVVDDPELCTVIFPALWRDEPLTVAVSTGGRAPFMAAAIRSHLAKSSERLGEWVEVAAEFRTAVRSEVTDPAEKTRLYQKFLEAGPLSRSADIPDTGRLEDWLKWLGVRP